MCCTINEGEASAEEDVRFQRTSVLRKDAGVRVSLVRRLREQVFYGARKSMQNTILKSRVSGVAR